MIVGSSMGGWLALLLARELRERKGAAPIAGMVLIAPAVDFTEELMWKQLADADQARDRGERRLECGRRITTRASPIRSPSG